MTKLIPVQLAGAKESYDIGNGYRLSCINSPLAHIYSFAWEIAIINEKGELDYQTPLTSDVEVFQTDEEANDFIFRAVEWANQWNREKKE